MPGIATNLATIRTRMHEAALRVGRDPATVRLVAVSKTQPATAIRTAHTTGQLLFGESRVQEARQKRDALQELPLQWHLIGPLQRNKVKMAVTLFDLIESVDSLALAEEIQRRVSTPLPILVQINIGGEAQKHGLAPAEAEHVIRAMAQLPGIQVRGLMTIPPWNEDPEASRPHFRALATLARHLAQQAIPGVTMAELSMGMSQDYTVAIEEGATLVRIGTALFGER
ncbi:MAG: YggS family pyridoxal phosphate-dependent enzyme [Magnetococcales bacterium]|nr:YggS family pyridoxal phosphate-dependent enzyme [Magnetococcales bacterium]